MTDNKKNTQGMFQHRWKDKEFYHNLYSENGKISSTRYVFVSLSKLVWVIVLFCLVLITMYTASYLLSIKNIKDTITGFTGSDTAKLAMVADLLNANIDKLINADARGYLEKILTFAFTILTSIVSAMTALKVGQAFVERNGKNKTQTDTTKTETELKNDNEVEK